MPAEAVLELRGLHKRFGGLLAVDGVSLDVHAGAIHSIIGPNGAGKTTLFNLVSGAIRPDGGTVRFLGRPVTGMQPQALARLGLVRTFQRTSVFGEMTALENLVLAVSARRGLAQALRLSAAVRRELADEAAALLSAVGLAPWADTPAAALSHGNQRALDLCIGVALRPRLLLMDEPLAGMAEADRERIADLILQLRDEHGLALVVVEHDIAMVMRLSDRITVLQNGRVLADGDARSVREDEEVKRVYLHGAFA